MNGLEKDGQGAGILHVITTIERGGAENQLLVLVREQVKLGLNVCVVPLKGRLELKEDFEKAGAIVNISLIRKTFLRQIFTLNLIKREFCIVHAHLPRAELITSLIKKKKGALVFSKHNAEPFFPKLGPILSRFLSRYVSMRADAIIAISTAVKEFMLSNSEVGKNSPIDVIHYGYDKSPFQLYLDKDLSKVRAESEQLVLTISRLVSQKDLFTLVMAFELCQRALPNIELVIFGEGPLLRELNLLCKKIKVSGKVHFLGRTSNPRGAIAAADLFALTSKYEGFGLVLLEAMCANTPIVAANNPAAIEVLGDQHPLLFQVGDIEDLANKIIKFFKSKDESEAIKTYQKERLSLYNPQDMAKKILRLYERELESK